MKNLGWNRSWTVMLVSCVSVARRSARPINTGKLLSPAALEVNKRYHLNAGGGLDAPMLKYDLRRSGLGLHKLRGMRGYLSVGNEPMRDIMDISPQSFDDGKQVPQAVGDRF